MCASRAEATSVCEAVFTIDVSVKHASGTAAHTRVHSYTLPAHAWRRSATVVEEVLARCGAACALPCAKPLLVECGGVGEAAWAKLVSWLCAAAAGGEHSWAEWPVDPPALLCI